MWEINVEIEGQRECEMVKKNINRKGTKISRWLKERTRFLLILRREAIGPYDAYGLNPRATRSEHIKNQNYLDLGAKNLTFGFICS